MRIGYFGDGPWAHRALEAVARDAGFDVAFVVPRRTNPDAELARIAEGLGIPVVADADVNSAVFLARVAAASVDLNVSMSYNQIFRAPFLSSAPMGAINCHAGALPFYRGRNVLNWAIINGETEFGVTVHHVDEGIDTGDIILQEMVPIAPEDDYGTVLAKAHEVCAALLVRALKRLRAGDAPRIPQSSIHPVGSYCGARREGDEWIDWAWPSERIHNFIRGIAPPGPAARSVLDGDEIAIVASELIPGAPSYLGTPGEVVGRAGAGVVVKTGTSTLRLVRAAPARNGSFEPGNGVPSWPLGRRFDRQARA